MLPGELLRGGIVPGVREHLDAAVQRHAQRGGEAQDVDDHDVIGA